MKMEWRCSLSVEQSRSSSPFPNVEQANSRLAVPGHALSYDWRHSEASDEYLLPEINVPRPLDPDDFARRSLLRDDDHADTSDRDSDTERQSIQAIDDENDERLIPDGDPNLVTWDGDDDPTNPLNWPRHRRWIATILIASFAFIAPMASTMVAPALETIADDFDIESDIERFLVMSIFLLAFAIGPFLWGPLSEVFGRARVMQGANLIFLLFNTVCGFARNKDQMMAFRFLGGIRGSAAQAIGGGILHDCFRNEERGLATAVYSLMPFLSPALAPIMGGYLTQYTTWRWVFWATSLFNICIQIACVFLLRETFAPAILATKVKKLRTLTGNAELHTKWQTADHSVKKLLFKALARPPIMLATQPALQAMALFMAYQYGLMYLCFAAIPMVFEKLYDQDVGRASLNYLSLGVGFVIGSADFRYPAG